MEQVIDEALQGISAADSDRDKATYLHDWLCRNIVYSEDPVGTLQNGHSTFDALCGDHAVCEGYALAYALLCQKAGLECQTIIGKTTQSAQANSGHAWNRVMIDEEWLYVDVTSDDGPFISNRFLLKPQSHFDSQGFVAFKNNLPDEIELK